MSAADDLYERDFHAWALHQAGLLRDGRLDDADIAHIAEEIESMGRTEKRELICGLTILFIHLLKWRYQSELRSRSWRATIAVQRDDLRDHLADNPSLSARLDEALQVAYRKARRTAAGETGLPLSSFPERNPWTWEEAMAEDVPLE